ncbi:P-loop NTPase fold protein [Lactococcus lactis]|uniref:P-loop NTPase fold protein n=1 Tax=Lactococcus lactis TaxID=1358 RepID=UPI00288DCBDE|nr:P-loop NTPase fold protein [Lactococcus lactis]MDT2927933.1 P-loop NTPase fold protein [Lactococcus lactis]
MNNIENAILNYMRSDDILAYQLEGNWGTGKTFFIKKFISEMNDDKYIGIYFSVYGYDSLQDLKAGLVDPIISEASLEGKFIDYYKKHREQINTVNRVLGSTRLKSVSSILDIISNNISGQVMENTTNIIIFIDDLERLSSKIALEDLFGLISSELLERKRYKIVLISNSEKIASVSYKSIREKIVGRSLQFETDFNLVIDITQKSLSNCFIWRDNEWLIQIIKSYLFDDGRINLRTLQTILSNYKFLEKNIDFNGTNDIVQQKLDMCKSLFLNSLVVTNELKAGKLDSNNLSAISDLCNSRTFANINIKDFNNEDEKIPKSISSKIIETYHTTKIFNDYIFYSDTVNDYIVSGLFKESGQNYWENWYKFFNLTEYVVPELVGKLFQFDNLTENELKSIQEKIMVEVVDARFPSLEEFISVYFRLCQFNKIGLLLIETKGDWRESFVSTGALKKLALQEKEKLTNFNMRFPIYRDIDIQSEDYNWMQQEYENIESQYKNIKYEEAIEAIFNEKLTSEYSIILNNVGIDEVLKRIESENYIDKYILKVPSSASKLFLYLRRNYNFSRDENSVKSIINQIKSGKPSISDKISLYRINQLLSFLEGIDEE